jgi:rare lipoprotein A
MAATMASEEEVAPVAIPAVAKAAPASSGTDYFIQAGAFEKKNNASHLADRLLSYGSTSVTPINARNKTFYRVRLGPINNKQQADKILSELKSSGHKGAVIVASN